MNDETHVKLSVDEVASLSQRALVSAGSSAAQAGAVAAVIAAAERDGCPQHGLLRLAGYAASLRSNKANHNPQPVLSEISPGVLRVAADRAFAPFALAAGFEAVCAKAQQQGIVALGINDCLHFSALWADVEPFADRGLVALAFTAGLKRVAPAGSMQPLFGTNPMAFAWPREGQPALVFDQASSAVSRGEIIIHQRAGQPLQPGWAIDVEGKPTTDAALALAGSLLPFGGYKGSALAMMIELLAGPLIGDLLSMESHAVDNGDGGPSLGGELIVVLDPARFVPDGKARLAQAEKLFEAIQANGDARLPSQRRYAARSTYLREGVNIPRRLHDEITKLSGAA